MDASPVAQTPFSLLGFRFEPATSLDVRAAFASPDPSPDILPSLGDLLSAIAPRPVAAQPVGFGGTLRDEASSPAALLPVAALLFDGFA